MKKIRGNILKIIGNTSLYQDWRYYRTKQWESKVIKSLVKKENSDNDKFDIEVINLNADDVCNSRCVMCNIWKQRKEYEISPEDLSNILKDPLYNNVKHIGITGGEPTLRADLSLLYESLFQALPNIDGASIITNCIDSDDVINKIDEVVDVCKKHSKSFSMMVSLDGIGEVHDKVRRIKGNYERVIKVHNYFVKKGISVTTGTTISKINVWDVDEILDYLRNNKMYGRFRVAEFINRLHNENNTDVIRNFDEDEKYHLILFFYKLIWSFESNKNFQRTYKSIINILSGGSRLIGCPYQSKGLVLNSKGEISYCAPKSKIIGNALKSSSLSLYKNNLEERSFIKHNFCKDCIHDYHAPITSSELSLEFSIANWRNYLSLGNNHSTKVLKNIKPKKISIDKKQFFITGWYGTETVGDKAILAQIIDEIQNQYPLGIDIVVSSLYPLITERTIKELNLKNVYVSPVYSPDFAAYIKGSDRVIIGGGPLMDLDELSILLYAFRLAKSINIETVIQGCGLGPLTQVKYQDAVKEILELADVINLRDNKSVELAKQWVKNTNSKKINMIGDPAKKYIEKVRNKKVDVKKINRLSCFFRELTTEYFNLSDNDMNDFRDKFESSLANYIKKKATEIGAEEIYFDHMHNFCVGNDDRDFSRRFISKYFSNYEIPVIYNKKLSTVDSIVNTMKSSKLNLCMRFHSVLFAQTLGLDFYAIDYTQGGKINNFLSDNKSMDKLISIDDIITNYGS